jgi:hypothetical protein
MRCELHYLPLDLFQETRKKCAYSKFYFQKKPNKNEGKT